MKKPKSINDLLASDKRLGAIKVRAEQRSVALAHVSAALPPPLAAAVVSAGLEGGRLTVGVAGAQWASRLRYMTDSLRLRVGSSMQVDIASVRIKVVLPRGAVPLKS